MIIQATTKAPNHDIAEYCWANLRRFLNVHFVTRLICDLHQVPKKHVRNAEKQATQIRYCLMQAQEYAQAADRVSLVTKPTLYYYSTMCLALAEVLLKQTGDSSLDRAREQHRHHGLQFRIGSQAKGSLDLQATASVLRAVPSIRENGERFGTFELWHRSAREMPIVGVREEQNGGTLRTSSRVLLFASDVRLSLPPLQGVSLLDAMLRLPTMMDFNASNGLTPQVVRGAVSTRFLNGIAQYSRFIIHPSFPSVVEEFLGNCLFDPATHSFIDFEQVDSSGGIINWRYDLQFGEINFKIPHGSMISTAEARFWSDDSPLNEFGWLYVALFIAGNYARYYPDRWVVDAESHSPLALAIEELIRVAVDRVPLLALSELSRSYFVPAA